MSSNYHPAQTPTPGASLTSRCLSSTKSTGTRAVEDGFSATESEDKNSSAETTPKKSTRKLKFTGDRNDAGAWYGSWEDQSPS